MLNWILSPMTRFDWLIVLAVLVGFGWLCTTPIGMRLALKWSVKSAEKAFKYDELFDVMDDEEEEA